MSEQDSVAREVGAIIHGIFKAFQDHAPGGIEDHMAADATVWDVFTPHLIRGRAERDKFHADDQAQMQARGALTMTIDGMVVDAWDDTALARFYLNFKYQPPNPAEGRVRITDVFRRVNGTWKIVHHHEGLVPTGIPPITEKKT
ncbi:MAG: nuclear transport factor 2 family protein [Rhodospirillaceae bacterium]|nr:nuclear transport factor 2 family protein [Rhodospirillaceae bacterium]